MTREDRNMTEAVAVTRPPRKASPLLLATIESQLALCVAYDDDTHVDGAVREIGLALMAECGHSVDGTEVHDLFMSLLDTDIQLRQLDENYDEYLGSLRLPRTIEQAFRKETDLQSDRNTFMQRLIGLAS